MVLTKAERAEADALQSLREFDTMVDDLNTVMTADEYNAARLDGGNWTDDLELLLPRRDVVSQAALEAMRRVFWVARDSRSYSATRCAINDERRLLGIALEQSTPLSSNRCTAKAPIVRALDNLLSAPEQRDN